MDISERNFEEAVEAALLRGGPDASAEAGVVAQPQQPYGIYAGGGFRKRSYKDYDKVLCLDTGVLHQFILATQPKAWEQLVQHYGDDAKERFFKRVAGEIEKRGTLQVLRKGIKDAGVRFDLAFFRPSSGLNEDLQNLYEANMFTVVRQLRYSTKNDNSIDVVVFLNGLPLFTIELKNPLNGQNVKHAVAQYMQDRDPREPLLKFERCLAHFAVDPDHAYVATKLGGNKTIFLPFNQGWNRGSGNPPRKTGFSTQYLWEHVWSKDSILELVQRFVHVIEEEDDKGRKTGEKTLIFTRYHQLDAVRRLVADARSKGPGNKYLIQHSAGSGKSNSIAWLAHQLSTLHDASDERVFDSIIVITDRRVLDRQLQRTVRQFEQTLGLVENIDQTSRQLKDALEAGKTIIVTTVQKFPVIVDQVAKLPQRRFAVIVDEAHSGQSGETTRQMHEVLSSPTLEQAEKDDVVLEEIEDKIVAAAKARGPLPNASIFAFTATPKEKTLQLFGEKQEDGSYAPFSLYSMRQAIEERFIMDVLQNYTTYHVYWNLLKKVQDDPKYDRKKAAYLARLFVDMHEHSINEKVQIIVEHFHEHSAHRIGGRAKAMIVTRSRKHAVRTAIALKKHLKEKGLPYQALVAFSGRVDDDGIPFTESQMNGFSERQTATVFKQQDYRFLVVAEKFQTGFDEPLLHTMYVDKKLSGLNAVQTLSRLNRVHPDKAETVILDFANHADDIQEAFQPYYEVSILSEGSDPALLYDLQHKLFTRDVFAEDEVEAFAAVYFRPGTQDELYGLLDDPVVRYGELTPDEQVEFRKDLGSYSRLYAFLSQVVTFVDADLESLYHFARYLLRKLPADDSSLPVSVQRQIEIESFRIAQTFQGAISLTPEKGELKPITGGGTTLVSPEDVEPLSEIIRDLNDRFGTEFEEKDRVFVEELLNRLAADPALEASMRVNTAENARLTFDHVVGDLLQDMVETNFELYKQVTDNPAFGNHFKELLFAMYRDGVEKTAPGPKKPRMIDAVVNALVAEMAPKKVILFGSGARDEMTAESDLDLLLVMEGEIDHHTEMVRAYKALRGLRGRPPVDVVVCSQKDLDDWGDVIGHVINEALVDGRVVYDAA